MKALLTIFLIMVLWPEQAVLANEKCNKLSASVIKEKITHYCTVTKDTQRSVCRKVDHLILQEEKKRGYELCQKMKELKLLDENVVQKHPINEGGGTRPIDKPIHDLDTNPSAKGEACKAPETIEEVKARLISELGEEYDEGKVMLCTTQVPGPKDKKRFECIDKENTEDVSCWVKSPPWEAIVDMQKHNLLNQKHLANINDVDRNEHKDMIGWDNYGRGNRYYRNGSRVKEK